MIDIESLGLKQDAAVIQISAQQFDPNEVGKIGEKFNAFVDIKSQNDRVIDPDTLCWWVGQDPVLFRQILLAEGRVSIADAMTGFYSFCKKVGGKNVWANSPAFDCNILRHVCDQDKNLKFPFPFWKEWDVRTTKKFATVDEQEIEAHFIANTLPEEQGHKHDARVDVLKQIILVQLVMAKTGIRV